MKSSRLEEDKNIEENIIKDVRHRFRLRKTKKETNAAAIKGIINLLRLKKENKITKDGILRDIGNLFEHKCIRNLFKLQKENKVIKDRILRSIRNLFEEEKNYYKPVRANNCWSNTYIKYESKGDKNKPLSIKKYLNNTRPNLKDIINNLKKSNTRKIQLTITINFISCKDNDENRVMHSKSNNKEIMINGKVDEVVQELFE